MNLFEDFLFRIEKKSPDSTHERVILTQYVGEEEHISMPSLIHNLPVTALDHSIFADNTTLKSVIFPENLEEIGNFTFSYCTSLERIQFPSTLKSIGKRCFQHCTSLREVIFPEGLTTLKKECFRQCSSLKGIYLPKSLILLEDSIFTDCIALETVDTHPAFVFRDRTHFTGCQSLINHQGMVVVNVKYMGYYGNHKVVDIPEGVEIIPMFCFSKKNKLTTVHIPETVVKIQGNAFDGCTKLEEVTLPPAVEELELATFHDCTSLRKVVLPADLTIISSSCFRKCKRLREIIWNKKLQKIGENAFSHTGIEVLPPLPSLGIIERNAFSSCQNLKEVYFLETLQKLGESSFFMCNALEIIQFNHSDIALDLLLPVDGVSAKRIFPYNENIRRAPENLISTWSKTHKNQFYLHQFLHWRALNAKEQDYFYQNWSGNTEENQVVDMIFLEGNAAEMSQYLELGFHLTLSQLDDYLAHRISQKQTEGTAILLEYQENHYSKEELEDYRTNAELVEMGFELPTVSQLQRKWIVEVNPHYIRLKGYKDDQEEELIPDKTIEGIAIKYVKYDIYDHPPSYEPLKRVFFSTGEDLALEEERQKFNLKTLEIPPNVTELHRFSFAGLEHLEEVFVPDTVDVIHTKAFYGCPNLKYVYFQEEFPSFVPLKNCPSLIFFGVKGGENHIE